MPSATTAGLLSQELGGSTYRKRRPVDLRRTILKEVKRGMSVAHASKMFKVGKRTIYDWQTKWRTERTLKPKAHPGRPPKLSDAQVQGMLDFLAEQPTATNVDIVTSLDVEVFANGRRSG